MRADGSDPVQLTNNTVYDVQPAYSPDCTRIAFETTRGRGPRDLHAVGPRGGTSDERHQHRRPALTDEQPDWGVGGSAAPSCASGPLTLADLPDPTLGVNVDVQVRTARRDQGRCLRRRHQGHRLRPAGGGAPDTRGLVARHAEGHGRASRARKDRAGKRQTGKFKSGLFQVRQSKKRSARGLTDLVLKGSSFSACRRAGGGKRASASLSRRQIRRLRASARGRFRTTGRNSSATVRGTIWDVTDRCDGTLTHVKRGTVIVRDFRRKKNITRARRARATSRRRPASAPVENRVSRSTSC